MPFSHRQTWIRAVSLVALIALAAVGISWTSSIEPALLDLRFLAARAVAGGAPPAPVEPMSTTASFLIALAAGAAMTLAMTARRGVRRWLIPLCAGFALVAPVATFVAWRLWMPYALILAQVATAVLVTGGLTIVSRAAKYRKSLGFAPGLLEASSGESVQSPPGIERVAAVVCADLRHSSNLIADNDPTEVQRVLGDYMTAMEAVIDAYGGYVNKYVGDAIIAVFGFPRDEEDVAKRAVGAAHAMLERYRTLAAEWSAAGLPVPDGLDIGVDAGALRFTTVGGHLRTQFDIVGNAAAAARRFQSLCATHGVSLIVPAEVADVHDVFDSGREQLEFIGEALVRGQGRRRLYALRHHRC